jgi:hypothetical protein
MALHVAGYFGWAGLGGGVAGDAELSDGVRSGGVDDVAFDQPGPVDVRERQIIWGGQDPDGATGQPVAAGGSCGSMVVGGSCAAAWPARSLNWESIQYSRACSSPSAVAWRSLRWSSGSGSRSGSR